MNTYIETLIQIECLSETELKALEKLNPCLKKRKLSKNEYLFLYGDILDISFMVEKGLIRVVIEDENGNEKILQFLKEKDFFDDCKSYFDSNPIAYYLQAIEETEITYFLMSDFKELILSYPALKSIGRNINNEYMLEHKNHVAVLMKKSPDDRYRHIQMNKPYLIQRASVTHLAQYLDMSRECLSRIRAKELIRQ